MRLRMLAQLNGNHDGAPWPPIGGIFETAHAGIAADLVRNGLAEVIEEPKPAPPPVETAEVAPPENTAKRVVKPRARKTT